MLSATVSVPPALASVPFTVTSLLKVLFPAIVCDPVVLTTVESTAIVPELLVTPSPPVK